LYGNTKGEEKLEYFKKEEISNLLSKRKNDLDKYRVNFDSYLNKNSLYNTGLVDLVLDKLNRKGLTYFNGDELWLKLSDFGYKEDKVIITSNGEYTSILPDLAYFIDKLNRKYDGIISIYDYESSDYKKSLMKVLTTLNYDVNKIELKKIFDLNFLSKEEFNNINNLDANALRYLLSSLRVDKENNINLENNKYSIDYIEQVNITIYKLLKNYKKKITKVNNYSTIDSDCAYIILNKLYEFEDVVNISYLKQLPCLLCDYLYELVTLFNDYYNTETIISDDENYTNERLNFLLAIKIVINNALELIGIIPREEL